VPWDAIHCPYCWSSCPEGRKPCAGRRGPPRKSRPLFDSFGYSPGVCMGPSAGSSPDALTAPAAPAE
jgi:hypothetical protein